MSSIGAMSSASAARAASVTTAEGGAPRIASSARRARVHHGLVREQYRQRVARRRGVGDVAGDGGAVLDLPGADLRGGAGERGQPAAEQRMLADLAEGGERADRDVRVARADSA